MHTIKLNFEYGCYLLWEYDEKGNFVENNPASHYLLPENLIKEIDKLEDDYQQTLNQDYPPDSIFASYDEETDFYQKCDLIIKLLNDNLSEKYKVFISKSLEKK